MKTRSRSPEMQVGRADISRRAALIAAATPPILSCCSSSPNSDTPSFTRFLFHSTDMFAIGRSVTLNEVTSTPFASLGMRVGSGAQTLLILATRSAQSTVWTGGPHIALEMQSGRVIRTVGLPHNLSGIAFPAPDPLAAGLRDLRAPTSASRTVDFADRDSFGDEVDSTIAVSGSAVIDILGTRLTTIHALEQCSCASLDWTFTNEFWAGSQDGRMWRSVQFIHPELDALEIELFRPPRV